ncbi:hypothetical protein CIL03_10080 [Virgibacillus indicus]|uniref:Uncharacterized protein n=1 Tax=Virgibacillus indicus TaxID=2024554 RepID=A0A265NAZ3_9BACI|nr:hypothetical protein [Virgibacillus indicus]OZU88634.1 hypothetical protein CIL03_10080 [Virgibacillus indicus]
MNNDLAKSQVYVGESDVYLIEGLELDVEFDYLSPEERTKAILELEENTFKQRNYSQFRVKMGL